MNTHVRKVHAIRSEMRVRDDVPYVRTLCMMDLAADPEDPAGFADFKGLNLVNAPWARWPGRGVWWTSHSDRITCLACKTVVASLAEPAA